MLIFAALAFGSFIVLVISFLFGHDADHDVDHDTDHDTDHDGDHGSEGATISFFSMKVLMTFVMGFGAAGTIARYYGADYVMSSVWGLICGVVLGLVMYLIIGLIYKQQGSAAVYTNEAFGQIGSVIIPIDANGVGSVGIHVHGQYITYMARSEKGTSISKGRMIEVINTAGTELVVREKV